MFADTGMTSLDECLLNSWTYYSMNQCVSMVQGEVLSTSRYLEDNFPGLLINDEKQTISSEKLEEYRSVYGIVAPRNQDSARTTKPQQPMINLPDTTASGGSVDDSARYRIVAPDWYIEDDEYQKYHLYINGRNGVISDVKLADGVATFQGDIPLGDYVNTLSSEEINEITNRLSYGVSIGKTISLESGATFGLSVDDPSLSLSVIQKDQEEVYSYGLKRGIIHWQNLSVYYDDTAEDVSVNLRGKDSYKGQLGMFSMDYYGQSNQYDTFMELQNASLMFKPFDNGMQIGVGWLEDSAYNEPYGTLGRSNLLKPHPFAGLELFNFSSFDHEFKVNQSGEGFNVFSRDYAYGSVYANGRFVSSVSLTPGFNHIDDRLLDDGQNIVEVKKRYNDGTEDSEHINYFKASLARSEESSFYVKVALGAKEIDGEYQGAVSLKTALNSDYGDIDFQTTYFQSFGDLAAEVEYEKLLGPLFIQLYGAATTNGEAGYGTRLSSNITSRINTSVEYRSVTSDSCAEQSRYLSYNCFDYLNLYLSIRLPFDVYTTYNYQYYDYRSSGFSSQESRIALNRFFTFSNGFSIGLIGSADQRDRDGIWSLSNAKNYYFGLNLSYNRGSQSTTYGAGYSKQNYGQSSNGTQQHSLSYASRLDDLTLNGRVGLNRSNYSTDHFASMSANYQSDFGMFFANGSFNQVSNQFSLSHDYIAAVNDKSFSLRTHQTGYTDTGVIFDTKNIPGDESFRVQVQGKNGLFSYSLDGSEQKFFALQPGRYRMMIRSGSINQSRLSDILLNETIVDIYKGDVRTIDFTYNDKIVIAFRSLNNSSEVLSIEGCDKTTVIDGEYEFTCLSRTVLNDGYFNATLDDVTVSCKYGKVSVFSDIYYSLGDVRCE